MSTTWDSSVSLFSGGENGGAHEVPGAQLGRPLRQSRSLRGRFNAPTPARPSGICLNASHQLLTCQDGPSPFTASTFCDGFSRCIYIGEVPHAGTAISEGKQPSPQTLHPRSTTFLLQPHSSFPLHPSLLQDSVLGSASRHQQSPSHLPSTVHILNRVSAHGHPPVPPS